MLDEPLGEKLPPFPLDDMVLDQLEHALGTTYGEDDTLVGGEYTLSQLLDFYSGYDESKIILVEERGDIPSLGLEDVPVYEYPDEIYSEESVMLAMIQEIRRLRSLLGEGHGPDHPSPL